MQAEHYWVLTDLETRNRDALAELRSQSSESAAELSRILAARAEEHERARDRMTANTTLPSPTCRRARRRRWPSCAPSYR